MVLFAVAGQTSNGAVKSNVEVEGSEFCPAPVVCDQPDLHPIQSSHLDRESSNPPRLTQPPASSYQRVVRKPAKFVAPERPCQSSGFVAPHLHLQLQLLKGIHFQTR